MVSVQWPRTTPRIISTAMTQVIEQGRSWNEQTFWANDVHLALSWSFLAGAIISIPVWLVVRRWPFCWVRLLQPCPGPSYSPRLWSPDNLSYIWPTTMVIIFFNYYIKNRWSL